jgi:hypothetical protein
MGYFEQFIAGDQGNMPAFRYQEFHANTLVTAGCASFFIPGQFRMCRPTLARFLV